MKKVTSLVGLLLMVGCSSNGGIIPDNGSADSGAGDDGAATTDDANDVPMDDSGVVLPKDPAPAENVSVGEIAAFQTLKVSIAKDGSAASSSVPLIAGKEALLRVYLKLGQGYVVHNVVGVLEITANGTTKTLKDVLAPAADSKDDVLLSTLNFQLTPDLVTTNTTFKVSLVEQKKTMAPTTGALASRYPTDGSTASLKATSVGSQMKITLVPMRYNADGSGRLPDTSQAQLDVYKNIFYAMYPAPVVSITVRQAINCPSALSAYGNGWSSALQTLSYLRQQDGAADDVYYYGIFEPTSSFASFCSSGCIAGLSSLAQSPMDSWARAGVGLGYGGNNDGYASAFTAAHEVGHQHGRNHAPCGGAQGVDPSYPYSQGATSTIGYALTNIGWVGQGTVITPTVGQYTVRDIMGYCDPKWISDYTYSALVSRMKIVNGAAQVPGPMLGYRLAQVDESGNVTNIGPRVTRSIPPGGEVKVIGGVKGWFYPYDHLPGGQLIIAD